MRITSIHAKDIMPIRQFDIEELSNVVVVAGANGVGKTRLLEWLIGFIRGLPSQPDQWIEVAATYRYERDTWGKPTLDTRVPEDAAKLKATLQRNRKRADQRGTVLNFESNRSIAQIKPLTFTWAAPDPFDEEVGWDFGFSYLRDRFQDTQHSIFRKVQSRRETLASDAEEHLRAYKQQTQEGTEEKSKLITLDPKKYPDPIQPFADAFIQLLGPKTLCDPNLQQQQLKFRDGEKEFPITALSSGEREVVNIVFDFILRSPSDCVVIFDEPELHLHPELSYKLIQTLATVGRRNQFIFCTHSADIISASLDNSVIFITPPRDDLSNQAITVREDDDTHQALKLVGQSIGIVALGRRIVLIEGNHGSLDKQTYGAILKNKFPNLVLVPSGGKSTIQSFSHIQEHVLNQAVWGIDFFMLCDGDTVPSGMGDVVGGDSSGDRLRVLSRYHLENYFLDERVIARIFRDLEPAESWLRDPDSISEKLKEIAQGYVSYAAALKVSSTLRERAGNIDLMPKNAHAMKTEELAAAFCDKADEERERITSVIDHQEVERVVRENVTTLESSLQNYDSWKKIIPGRPILKTFCSGKYSSIDFGRFKTAYLKAAEDAYAEPFADIVSIFEDFSNYGVS